MNPYITGIGGGMAGGFAAGAPFGPVGMIAGPILGGLYGGLMTHANEQNRDILNKAYEDAIKSATQHGRDMMDYHRHGEARAQQFISPLDGLMQKWYGVNTNPNGGKLPPGAVPAAPHISSLYGGK